MSDRLNWERNGAGWPNRTASRFVTAAGLRWHVQQVGDGPTALLVHGTGASTHSWAGLIPLLARRFTVVACDLPGHGFTDMPPSGGLSLPGIAHSLGHLTSAMAIKPEIAIGHSAGSAILIRMALDQVMAPRTIVSLNGALLPFGGLAGQIFSPLAKMLVLNPFVPRLFAWRATDRRAVERLINGTGSTVPPSYIDRYAELFRSPGHCAAALGMMASWDLPALMRDIPKLKVPLVLVAGSADRAISSDDAFRVRDLVPGASVEVLPGLGHLAHEEAPDAVFAVVEQAAQRHGFVAAQ